MGMNATACFSRACPLKTYMTVTLCQCRCKYKCHILCPRNRETKHTGTLGIARQTSCSLLRLRWRQQLTMNRPCCNKLQAHQTRQKASDNVVQCFTPAIFVYVSDPKSTLLYILS